MPEEQPAAQRFIFVPYARPPGTPDDTGARPLPASITYWACSSIRLNGSPYNGKPLTPGPITLSLLVANSGALGAWVTARFYLTDPTTGFHPGDLLGTTEQFYVPANTLAKNARRSPQQQYTVPDGKAHLCLFAEAWSGMDPTTDPGNPVVDRHWGQQNLQILTAQAGQQLPIPFRVVGQPPGGRYLMRVRQPAREEDNVFLLPSDALQIVDAEQGGARATELPVELRPYEQRTFQVVVVIPADARAGTSARFVIEQTTTVAERDTPVGGIGITITISD